MQHNRPQESVINSSHENSIRSYYDRLSRGDAVYLLRGVSEGYGSELPDPENEPFFFKGTVFDSNVNKYRGGIDIVQWPSLKEGPPIGQKIVPSFTVSPREVFLTPELMDVLKNRTSLPPTRKGRLDRFLESKKGNFRNILGREAARVILERFACDPKDASGNLLTKR